MGIRQQKTQPKKPQIIVTLIEYRCEPEHLNMEEVLDKLREMGAAEIISTKIVDGTI